MAIQTFLDLEKLELESDCGIILNPIVGPEPITGKHGLAGTESVSQQLHLILVLHD